MKLREYFDRYSVKHRGFAKTLGISTFTLYNLLNDRSVPKLEKAWEIEKETRGMVTLYDWVGTFDKEYKPSKEEHKPKCQ
jgi:DNA-binding XRE family transcriptional regulator